MGDRQTLERTPEIIMAMVCKSLFRASTGRASTGRAALRSGLALAAWMAAAVSAHAQSTPAADLLKVAVKAPEAAAAQVYAFEVRDVVTSQREDKGSSTRTITATIDPTLPKGKRVTITSATGQDTDGKPIDAKQVDRQYERNTMGDLWCDSLSSGAQSPIAELPSEPGTRRMTFIPLPGPNTSSDIGRVYKLVKADVVVDEATNLFRTFIARLEQPFKPVPIFSVKAFELNGECVPAPNGRAYAETLTTTITGSAMGNTFTSKTVRKVTGLRPPANAPR
jgi:hypothetical protein